MDVLTFINPSIGNVLVLGILIRVILAVFEMIVLEKNFYGQEGWELVCVYWVWHYF